METKRFIVFSVLILVLSITIVFAFQEKARDNSAAPENSPVIGEDWTLEPYYVFTDSSLIKGFVEVRHDFGNVFSADLSKGQLRAIQILGVKTEPVGIFTIVGNACRNDKDCPDGEYCDKSNAVRGMGTCAPIDEEEPAPERGCYPSDQTPWGIERIYKNSEITQTFGGAGIKVAVLDTGVMQSHLDLKNRIISCETKITRFIPDTKNCEDGHGHGTHVAGTILADAGSDGLGIYGVAPEASLIAVKVCDKRGWCYGDDIAAGINYAISEGANVISMSLGGSSPDSRILSSVQKAVEKGVLVIAAAGNSGPNLDTINYPGAFKEVVSVAATNIDDAVADFSSRGIDDTEFKYEDKYLEVAAPGVSVESTYIDGCYRVWSGTSMATPHVSGLAAKFWAENPSLSSLGIRNLLQERAEDITQGKHARVGYDPASGYGLPVAA